MKKSKFNLFKNNKNNISLLFLSFVLLFSFLFTSKIVFAQQDNTQDATNTATDKAVQKINDLGNNGKGLIPDCGRTSNIPSTGNNFCSPKDAALLVSKLLQVAAYLVIIALVLIVILASVGYVYQGDNIEYIKKYKKYIWNAVIALGVLMLVFTVIFGLLSGVGFNSQILDFLKQTFAYRDFNIFPHAMAAKDAIPEIAADNGKYVDFFGGQTLGSIVLLFVKFLVNYIAAPILTLSVILAGGKFVAAQGNPEELAKAKRFAMRVIIGIAVAAAAEILILTLLNTVESVKKDAGSTTSSSTAIVIIRNNKI